MHIAIQNILRFIFLIVIQVFLLDNIQVMGYITPMIYILIILLLPIELPRWASLLIAFALGLIIDMFNNTGGIHTAATVLIAFLRNPVIKLFISEEEISKPTPSISNFGLSAYLKYLILLVLTHHIVLFTLASFSLFNITLLLPKIFISSLVTIILVLAVQSLGSLKRQ